MQEFKTLVVSEESFFIEKEAIYCYMNFQKECKRK